MKRTTVGGVGLYRFRSLSEHDGIDHFVSTRHGGVSEGPYAQLNLGLHVGDDHARVVTNRERLASASGFALSDFVVCRQVHSATVAVVDGSMRGRGTRSDADALADTDAAIVRDAGVCIAVMLADCVPVIAHDPVVGAIGVAHAGWRGTVACVTSRMIEAMVSTFGCEPRDIVAGVGPSIGPKAYEVGTEVVAAAETISGGRDIIRRGHAGRHTFDLWTANRLQLEASGVPRDQIEIAGICTHTHSDEFFSERKTKPTGRFMACAVLRV